MYTYGEKHITPERIRDWLYTSQNADKIFKDFYEKNKVPLSLEYLYGTSDKYPQKSIGYEINTDFRSLNPEYSQLKETMNFSETDWIHPFSDVGIHRHIRYFPAFAHHHAFFELCYVLDGSCTQTITDGSETLIKRQLHLKTGDLLIIPPDCEHSITMNSDSIAVNILIRKSTFKTAFLSNLPIESSLYNFFSNTIYEADSQKLILCHTQGDQNLQNLFYWIAEEYCNNDIYSNHIINQMLSVFFSTMMRCYSDSMEFIGDSTDCMHLVPSILQYMERNYNTVNVKSIAAHFNFNASYLGQIFKEKTGISLIDALIDIRITKACELLLTTSLSIDMIAEITGYADTTYFIRLFKNHMHQTPLQYRKTNQNNSE